MTAEAVDPTGDEVLTGYLDGALSPDERASLEGRLAGDPALAARLARLASGADGIAEAFAALESAAPSARLEAGLARAVAEFDARRNRPFQRHGWRMAIAASILFFLVGGVIGNLLPRLAAPPEGDAAQHEKWRAVVAEYLTLYTADTLAGPPIERTVEAAELSRVGGKLDLALDPDKLDLPSLDFRRAQVFSLNGEPLLQIAFLSPSEGPVALCITATDEADRKPDFEVREGRNIVYWARSGRAYMLIGTTPRAELERLADTLAGRLA